MRPAYENKNLIILIITDSFIFSLLRNTAYLERPHNSEIALYRFSFIAILLSL